MDSNLMTILLTIIAGGLGYLVRYFVEKRKELLSEVNKERRELYQKFINLVVDLIKGSKNEKRIQDKTITELFEFYKKYILYASPKVINRFSDYFQFLYSQKENRDSENTRIHFSKLTAIMIAMRSDLGLKNYNLGKDGVNIMRALLTDFDKIMKKGN